MKINPILAIATLLATSFYSLAQAEEAPPDDRWYVAPFGTYLNNGGDRSAKDGWGGGMGFGKMLDEHFNVELKGFYQGSSGETGGRWDMTGGTADLQYYLYRDTFSPYTVFGVGAMNTSHGGDSGTGFIGEAGLGFTYELMDNLLVRSDVRYRYNNNFNAHLQSGTDEFHDMTVNVGFVIPFGEKPAPAVAESPAPVPPPVVADCSTQDDDNDGVNNCEDRCPNSLSGIKVSKFGCWVVDVKFDNDKAIIKEQYFPNLDSVAEAIKQHPDVMIEVQGHTSKTGGYKHNMALSERRAQAVKDYLVGTHHLPNVTSHGYSWDRPIDTNDTEEGRANNRRVQLEVNGQPQDAP